MVRRSLGGLIITFVLLSTSLSPVHALDIPETTIISPLPPTDSILVSAFRYTNGRGFDYVELRNTSDEIIEIGDLSLLLKYADASTDYDCSVAMTGYLLPDAYLAFAHPSATVLGAREYVQSLSNCVSPEVENFDREIQVYRSGELVESVKIMTADMGAAPSRAWDRGGFTDTYRKGVLSSDFSKTARRVTIEGDILYSSIPYQLPDRPILQLQEVMPNPLLCPQDNTVTCRPYIKLSNKTSDPVILDQFRLRSGALAERSSRFNTSYLTGVLAGNSWMIIDRDRDGAALSIDKAEGTLWLEDYYGLHAYVNDWSPYDHADTVGRRGFVWAHNSLATNSEDAWQWVLPTIDVEESRLVLPIQDDEPVTGSTLVPCRDGQYRSEETNRCRSIALVGETLKPCSDGQYRSEETNRCRSIAETAAATLRPCVEGQFRNPETGRCKKIASTEDILTPCDSGWERNPDTNRCRKVREAAMPTVPYAIEPLTKAANDSLGWWAFGGVAALAGGYAVWEWHHEVRRLIQKVIHALSAKR